MPNYFDFSISLAGDGTFTLALQPPINISGMGFRFDLMERFNATPRVSLYCSSGFNNVSGLNVTNGPGAVMQVQYFYKYVSGLSYQNMAFACTRTDSGHVTPAVAGFISLQPP